MELVGKLKDEISKAKDKKEAKEIMENAGMKLTDDELDAVAGGGGIAVAGGGRTKQRARNWKQNTTGGRLVYERWEADGCPDLRTIPRI